MTSKKLILLHLAEFRRQLMFLTYRLPQTLRWVLHIFVVYLLLFTFFRLLTFALFKPEDGKTAEILQAFALGFRFDLRWISLLLLPLVSAGMVPQLSPYYSGRTRRIWTWYLAIATFFVFLIYAIDYGCFAYFRVRLGATVLNFADDTVIAAQMLWEMYPLFWMIAGLITIVYLLRTVFQRLHKRASSEGATEEKEAGYRWFIYTGMLLLLFIWGGFPGPLRWNAAFQQPDNFGGYLSLNPLQTVYSTLGHRKPQFDAGKARAMYPVMREWMGWEKEKNDHANKGVPSVNGFSSKPNVVLVVCESFSMYKTSMSGNALNTTPYFKSLSENGLFFSRCFSPHFSTARGMFAIITGIPDVQLAKFSTRTEAVYNQHTIINDFDGYRKFYFLGGSPSFNNFEGLMQNVKGIEMKTEGAFVAPPIDVWGISDKALFMEANNVFARQKEPFFAIVQTADNHPPYTIAAEDNDFTRQQVSEDSLAAYGFESEEQYNAMRYFDYSVKQFMEAARKEAYFENTLFVFIGDHGVAGNATKMYQAAWTENRLTEMHVPMLFYAPALISPQQREDVVSQVDVLPTIAAITGQPHRNTTLGRNVAGVVPNPGAFFIRHDEGEIGLVTDDVYYTKNILFEKEKLQLINPKATYNRLQLDSLRNKLGMVSTAYLETARWMLMNNRQQNGK